MIGLRRASLLAVGGLVAMACLGGIGQAAPERPVYTCVLSGKLAGPDVHFIASDGIRLVGHRFGSGSTAVVLAHQADNNLCGWVDEGRRLAAQGFSALLFDFRGYGASQQGGNESLPLDVAAAVEEARSLGAKKVVLMGASMGGWAVVMAAQTIRPQVQGVVAVSAPATWSSGSALTAAHRLRLPALYVSAKSDSGDSRAMYAATASKHKQLLVVPGAFHGTTLVDLSKPARTTIERFLHQYGD